MIPNDPQPFTRRTLVDAFSEALEDRPAADPVSLLAELLGVSPPMRSVSVADIEAVWLAWLEATGRSRARLDQKRRRLIRLRLRDYPVADLVAAVRGWRHDSFHRGENAGQRVYNDLELLLRDAAHVERFRDAEYAHRLGAPSNVAELLRNIRESS